MTTPKEPMRPRAYRVWNKVDKRWWDDIVVDQGGRLMCVGDGFYSEIDNPDTFVVLYATGKLDKDGKMLFDKDVVSQDVYVGTVIWHEEPSGWRVEYPWWNPRAKCIDSLIDDLWQPHKIERLGSSLENPELLEGGES